MVFRAIGPASRAAQAKKGSRAVPSLSQTKRDPTRGYEILVIHRTESLGRRAERMSSPREGMPSPGSG
jgi:hypothetical protein